MIDHRTGPHALGARIARAAAVLAAVAALGTLGIPASADEPAITVATMPIDGGSEVLYADAMGFFKKVGLNVQVRVMPNGGAITAAVLSGAVDVGFANIVTVANAYKKGLPVTLLAPAGTYQATAPTMVCVAPNGSPVHSAKDMDGKTIAINDLNSIVQYGVQDWIDQHGGDSRTVSFVEMPFPSIPAALEQNRFPAAVLSEPWIADARKVGRVVSNCFDSVGRDYVLSGYVTTTSWTGAHPDQARAFQRIIFDTARWANAHQAQTRQILAQSSKIDPERLSAMVRTHYAEAFEPAQIQPVIDVSAKYGGLKAPFPASELFYRPAR
jgi:NitT/TauT family transport system substrate-binding protein